MTARKPKPKPRGGARPGAGRPRTRPEGARKVQVVLSPAAAEAWAAYEGDRSRWVSGLVEAATPSGGVYAEALTHAAALVVHDTVEAPLTTDERDFLKKLAGKAKVSARVVRVNSSVSMPLRGND